MAAGSSAPELFTAIIGKSRLFLLVHFWLGSRGGGGGGGGRGGRGGGGKRAAFLHILLQIFCFVIRVLSYGYHIFHVVPKHMLTMAWWHLTDQFKASLINSLPNDKFLSWSKLKGFADDKINVTYKIEIRIGKSRKHCWKRRKCW